jgi:hypothetical protein
VLTAVYCTLRSLQMEGAWTGCSIASPPPPASSTRCVDGLRLHLSAGQRADLEGHVNHLYYTRWAELD